VNNLYSMTRIIYFFNRRIFVWFFTWVFFAAGPSYAGETASQSILSVDGRLIRDGWHFVMEQQGIRVYNRPWPGSPMPEALAYTVIRVSPGRLYAVVTDYDHFAGFIPYVTRSRTLRQEGELRLVHQHLHFPGPLTDRYYTMASRAVSGKPENSFRVEWQLVPESVGIAADETGIVPSAFSGFWELIPGGSGTTTEAVYSIHFDPGGILPSRLATLAMNRYLPRVVDAVRARALQPVDSDTRGSGPSDGKRR
jgi:ribosome-associated toxin RatA of RatAB toxin-antitoxin module